jgi:uncharacterized sporulation protein YeaH/YhbH (DUF444 family)
LNTTGKGRCAIPRRIEEDHKDFRDVYSGKIRKELKKWISNGSIFRHRGDGKRVRINIPRIDIPHIVYGGGNEGIGRGLGKKGDVIGKDDPKGKGRNAGEGHEDGIMVDIELEEILKLLKDELELPDLKPKQQNVFEETKIKYNDISKQGPEALRHSKRTFLQAMKRMAASGELNQFHNVPGYPDPIRLIKPINGDRRYRQYKEIKIPASNAVIFFARDGSGSMDETKCEIVSDMAWWIDLWIRHFYKRVESNYIWHDTVAQEVDQKMFYNYRYGGGTYCSSAFSLIAKMLENRYPVDKWNVYVFYFTDGENWDDDNERLVSVIRKHFTPEAVNMIGITQVLSYTYENSVKHFIDNSPEIGDHIRTTSIDAPQEDKPSPIRLFYPAPTLGDEERDNQIKKAINELLGKGKTKEKAKVSS